MDAKEPSQQIADSTSFALLEHTAAASGIYFKAAREKFLALSNVSF